jgi:membrane-bound ClpP family serine protease
MSTLDTECCPNSCAPTKSGVWDLFGMGAGLVCLVHCLALPLVLAVLPALGFLHGDHDLTHAFLLGWIALFSTSIFLGYKKHRQRFVLNLMLAGLCFVIAATFHHLFGVTEAMEVPVITLGNLLLVSSHFMNWRITRQFHA